MSHLPDNPLPESETENNAHKYIESTLGSVSLRTLSQEITSRTDGEEFIRRYRALSRLSLTVSKREWSNGRSEYIIGIPQLNGGDLNHLLYYAAPYKSKYFGLDTDDIVADWTDLFDKFDQQQNQRLNRHLTIPGFATFIGFRKRLLDMMVDYQGAQEVAVERGRLLRSDFVETLNPEINLIVDKDKVTLQTLTVEQVVGVLYLAAFSPDITNKWPKHVGYTNIENSRAMNPLGPTQIIVQVLAEKDAFLSSDIGVKLLSYLDAGLVEAKAAPIELEPEIPLDDWVFADSLILKALTDDNAEFDPNDDDEDF